MQIPFSRQPTLRQLADFSADSARFDDPGLSDFERNCVARFSARTADAFSSAFDGMEVSPFLVTFIFGFVSFLHQTAIRNEPSKENNNKTHRK